MRVTGFVTAFVLMTVAAMAAHGPEWPSTAVDARVFSAWDQATLAGLLIVAALYWTGSRRLAARRVRHVYIEHAAFAVGWLALVIAVLPFVDAAVIERFSAHMAQHELMTLVAAPLLVAGRPLSRFMWALPAGWRRRGAAPLQHRVTTGVTKALTTPAAAWALHGAVLWIWHMPSLYNLAVRSEPAHMVQHAMFVGTSVLFWSGLVYGRYGRAGYGAAVFFVFTTAVHTGILGALLTVARLPLYSVYATVPGMSGEAVLADQQLAGLVMWIPAGLLLTLVGIALFAAWLGESDRRVRISASSSSV
jgi:putative membrane protein